MEISARADRFGQDDPGRVDRLPDVDEITSSRDLFDQHRRQSFGPQLLMHAEIVYLRAPDRLSADAELYGYPRNEGHKLSRLGRADADVPLFPPARRLQGPSAYRSAMRRPAAVLRTHQLRNDVEYLNRNVSCTSST